MRFAISGFLFLALIGGLTAWGDTAINSDVTLSQEMSPYVVSLSKSVYTYNYSRLANFGFSSSDPSLEQIFLYLRDTSAKYWDSSPPYTGLDNPGLYVAIDPVVSRSFGGDHPLLVQVELMAGTKYLDLRSIHLSKEGANLIPAKVRERLKSAGCDQEKYHYIFQKNMSGACKKIAARTLKELGVDFIQYAWLADSYEQCPNRPGKAMILLTTDHMKRESVKFFTETIPSPDPSQDDRLAIESLFRLSQLARDPDYSEPNRYKPLWPGLTGEPLSGEVAWIKNHLLDCD